MRWAVLGLPQAGILANKHLHWKLASFGYFEHVNTPGLWYHESHPILFTLAVNDFGVKYVNKEDVDHLVESINAPNTLTKDWTGNIYCGIALNCRGSGGSIPPPFFYSGGKIKIRGAKIERD